MLLGVYAIACLAGEAGFSDSVQDPNNGRV
jgi:hypothetical protein